MTRRGIEVARLSALAAILWLAPARVGAQPDPVTLRAEGLFGDQALDEEGLAQILVRLTNQTDEPIRGHLHVTSNQWNTDVSPATRLAVDLPPRATRLVRTDVMETSSSYGLRVTFEIEGGATVSTSLTGTHRSGSAVVVFASPARMYGDLASMTASTLGVDFGLGQVQVDPESGDPLLPEDPFAWSGVDILLATVDAVERVEGAARDALLGFVAAGGTIVLVPSGPDDVSRPVVRELFGTLQVEVIAEGEPVTGALDPAVRLRYVGDARVRWESFGASVAHGFGRAYLLGWDANGASMDSAPLARVMTQLLLLPSEGPLHAFGTDPQGSSALRAVLDPNESFRPALGLVAVLLLLYVLAIGPLNFRYVERRGNPIVALVTTPAIAFACIALMAITAYASKGVLSRFRAIELVELPNDSALGVRSRYVGYFLTRPAVFDAIPEAGTRVDLAHRSGGGSPPESVRRGGAVALRGIRASLWETVVAREQAVHRGDVRLRIEPGAVTRVWNLGRRPLRAAFYVDASGLVHPLGDLPVGSREPVVTGAALPALEMWRIEDASFGDSTFDEVTRMLRADEDGRAALRAMLVGYLSNTQGRAGVWAFLDEDVAHASTEGFREDWSRRLVFVHVEGTP